MTGGKNLFLDADTPPCGRPWSPFPAPTKVENNGAGGELYLDQEYGNAGDYSEEDANEQDFIDVGGF